MLQKSFDALTYLVAFALKLRQVSFETLDLFRTLGELGAQLCLLACSLFQLQFEFECMFFRGVRSLFGSRSLFALFAQKVDGAKHPLFKRLKRFCLEIGWMAGFSRLHMMDD